MSDFDCLGVDRQQWKEQVEPVILEWAWQSMPWANKIEVFFNHQYILTGLISGF